ncbi:MAG: hypothetical protein RLZZ214_2110 [Verrucomicrobiota bacterium]|jgi:hypothetical protein
MRYFDTGVLLKLYLPELRAAEAVTFVNDSSGKPPVNHLHELEIRSFLRQKVGRGEVTPTGVRRVDRPSRIRSHLRRA